MSYGHNMYPEPGYYDLMSWDLRDRNLPERLELDELMRLRDCFEVDLTCFRDPDTARFYMREMENRLSGRAIAVAATLRAGLQVEPDTWDNFTKLAGVRPDAPLDIALRAHDQRRLFMRVVHCALDFRGTLDDAVTFLLQGLASAHTDQSQSFPPELANADLELLLKLRERFRGGDTDTLQQND